MRWTRGKINAGGGVTALAFALGLYQLSDQVATNHPGRSTVFFVGSVALAVVGLALFGWGAWDAWQRRPLRELARVSKEIADELNDFDFERGVTDPTARVPRSWRLPTDTPEDRRQQVHHDETDDVLSHSNTTMASYRRKYEARAIAAYEMALELGRAKEEDRTRFEHPTNVLGLREVAQKLGVIAERIKLDLG